MKKFNCVWTETHTAIVEAKDRAEAQDKMMDNDFISDETAEVDSIDVFEIKE